MKFKFAILIVAGMLCAVAAETHAEGLKGLAQRNDVNRPGGVASAPSASSPITSLQGLLDNFEQIQIADLKTARAYADSENDVAATTCYDAWIDQVERIARVRDENPTPDTPQIITAFQKARNLVKRLDTDSPLRMACAALAADAKQDVKQFIGALISGAAFKALVP